MPFVKQVVIKKVREREFVKKKKPALSVAGNRGRWRDKKKYTIKRQELTTFKQDGIRE